MTYAYKTDQEKKGKYTTSGSNLTCLKRKLFLKNIKKTSGKGLVLIKAQEPYL